MWTFVMLCQLANDVIDRCKWSEKDSNLTVAWNERHIYQCLGSEVHAWRTGCVSWEMHIHVSGYCCRTE